MELGSLRQYLLDAPDASWLPQDFLPRMFFAVASMPKKVLINLIMEITCFISDQLPYVGMYIKKAWEPNHCSSHQLRLWHVPIAVGRATRRAHANMYKTLPT